MTGEFAGLPAPANGSKFWKFYKVSPKTSCQQQRLVVLQEPEKGRMIEDSDPWRRKLWITPPGKAPRAVSSGPGPGKYGMGS